MFEAGSSVKMVKSNETKIKIKPKDKESQNKINSWTNG